MTSDEQVAIATRLEITTWLNPATEVEELVVKIIIHTGSGVTETVYRPNDLYVLVNDLMTVIKFLLDLPLDDDEGG